MDDCMWEEVLSFCGAGGQAAACCEARRKNLHTAARSRAARPYFKTVLHAKTPPQHESPDSAARKVGLHLVELARQRLGEGRPGAADDAEATIGDVIASVIRDASLPGKPDLALVFASGAWAGLLAPVRAELRARLPASTLIVGGAARGVLCSMRASVVEIEHGDALSIALVRFVAGTRVSALYVGPRGDPHAPRLVAGRREREPRVAFILAEDQRAAHEALELVNENLSDIRCAAFPGAPMEGTRPPTRPTVTGGILGSPEDGERGALMLDAPFVDEAPEAGVNVFGGLIWDPVPALPDDRPAGAIVVQVSGAGFAAASAVSRGAKMVGSAIFKVVEADKRRVQVCPGHFVTVDSVKALRRVAVRDLNGIVRAVEDDLRLSPGATLRMVAEAEAGGALPRPLLFGVYKCDATVNDNNPPTKGYALLAPQHLEDDGALVIDDFAAEGDYVAWHTLCPRASEDECRAALREAASEARVALKLGGCTTSRQKDGAMQEDSAVVPLRFGVDTSLSVLGAVVFTCCGRGAPFHGAPNRDSDALRDGLPRLPIAGCFANGEIGPPPFREHGGGISSDAAAHIAGFTCSSALIRVDGLVDGA
ncbi:hypothetical protein M885DRAFT_563714 [Pelagophyceae sp. CCMP2097]|nr:hypothetical protein M885DRAFT_563714 [Pelagophyceae sp. CCMP2097]